MTQKVPPSLIESATTTLAGIVEKATTAEIASETADKFPDAADLKYHQGIAKAWVNFNGTGTVAIRDSHNVTSITDNSTGDYDVNWSITMANSDYCAVGMCSGNTLAIDPAGTYTTTATEVYAFNAAGVFQDPSIVCVALLGDI